MQDLVQDLESAALDGGLMLDFKLQGCCEVFQLQWSGLDADSETKAERPLRMKGVDDEDIQGFSDLSVNAAAFVPFTSQSCAGCSLTSDTPSQQELLIWEHVLCRPLI